MSILSTELIGAEGARLLREKVAWETPQALKRRGERKAEAACPGATGIRRAGMKVVP